MSPSLYRREFESTHRRPTSTAAATRLIEEIDLMAEALTGDRQHFWLKPSSTPGSKQPTGPQPDTYDWTWTKAERDRERQNPSKTEEL
jgi:hypothetical protein